MDTKWGGARNLFGGEGGFLVEATGHGVVVAELLGALDVIDLKPASRSSSTPATSSPTRRPSPTTSAARVRGRSIQSMKSGEGFVFEFTGPGRVLAQSRNPSGLLGYIGANLPGGRA
ncbi:AIM24 family protein [Yinghuangia aomiensis]